MPRIIGCIDGTLFRIVRPANQVDGPWICRKMYPAINALAVCDHRGKFTYFMANHPGSSHDSYVLR
ncbi:MAG: hypothetical protein DI539_27255 [Flavobacterium psychrophilum]|nr:MAG: hypothetical protein DI539_27255 [Flavobacterium psychrophilum]